MRRISIAFLVLCGVFFAGLVAAEETLVVLDANGSVVGPIIGKPPILTLDEKDDFYFIYRVADTFMVMRIFDSNTVSPVASTYSQPPTELLFWSQTGCQGSIIGIGSAPIVFLTDEIHRFPNTNELWRIHTELTTPQLVLSEERFIEGNPTPICDDMNPGGEMRSVTSWEVLGTLDLAYPLSVAINPVIFQDQFQTGDLTRWSNY